MPGRPIFDKHAVEDKVLADIARDCGKAVDSIEDVYSCTPLQADTMAETMISSRTSAFQFVFALGASIDESLLISAVQHTIARHAILRTRIVDNPTTGIVQVVLTEGELPQQLANVTVDEYLRVEADKSMDMGAALLSTAIIDHKLVLSMHHAIMDHSALTLWLTDVFQFYKGQDLVTRSPYKDFVSRCLNIDQSAAKDFWAQRFKGHPAIWPKVPAAYVAQATEVCRQHVTLDSDVSDDAILQISSFIETAFGLTLAAYADHDNVAFGLILSGRNVSSSGHASTMGPTIAIVPVQVNVQGRSAVEAVVQERTTSRRQLQTSSALHVGLPQIRGASEAANAASRFQAVLNIRPSLADETASDTVSFERMREPPGPFAIFVSCNLTPSRRGMELEAQFDSNVLEQCQVRSLLHQLQYNLNILLHADWKRTLKTLPSLNPQDESRILEQNARLETTIEQCLHDIFQQQAIRQPDFVAVEAADGHATYGQLDTMSTRVAVELRRRGVARGSYVPLIFEKSLWATVAILAVMKAGGAYVPIERNDPHERKLGLVHRVGAQMIVTSREEHSRSTSLAEDIFVLDMESFRMLPDVEDQILEGTSPDDVAVILFTSGSTGKPKGVLLEHQCLSTSLTAISKAIGWGSGRRVLQFAAYVWDLSLGETFGALLFGGCLCVPSEHERSDDLLRYVQDSNFDMAVFTPTVLRTLSRAHLPTLHTVISAGEAIGQDIIAHWGQGNVRLLNGWGPCETSILSSIAEVNCGSRHPESIGFPLGCALWLVSPDDPEKLVPIGSVGEIYVEGPGVARGYLEDTREKSAGFIRPPSWAPSRSAKSTRFFRTGDLARYNPDLSISFIGRRDHQVKIRGQRFELGEVEAAILGFDKVRDVVTTTRISAGRTELVAVLTVSDDHDSQRTEPLCVLTGEPAVRAAECVMELETNTRSHLPSYMVPTIWIAVENMPRTTSAKVDRIKVRDWVKEQDLPTIKLDVHSTSRKLTVPASETERILQEGWATVLGCSNEDIGRESIFLQLGGDSIRAMQAAGLLRRRGYDVRTASLLSNDVLATIAAAIPKVKLPASPPPEERLVPKTSFTLPSSHTSGMSIAHVSKATDAQAGMLAAGQNRSNGYHVDFLLDFTPPVALSRLKTACEFVIDHHAILRTVFVQHGSQLYQAVLRNDSNLRQLVNSSTSGSLSTPSDFEKGCPIVKFDMLADGDACVRLRISLHHALYDAYSLNLIFADLNAAYSGILLSSGSDFHAWVAQLETQDQTSSHDFWKAHLSGSTVSYLVPPPEGPIGGPALDGKFGFDAPLPSRSTVGTPASSLRAAWALLLSQALGHDDVVFGEVSAARLGDTQEYDQVRGPTVNNVPVRARINGSTSLESLISAMQSEFHHSMPHHRVGYSKIVRDCTDWPNWTRFSSTIVYQPEGLLKPEVRMGDSKANVSHDGRLGDTADVWVIATPKNADTVNIELHFDESVLPAKQVQWISECFTMILRAVADDSSQSVQRLRDRLRSTLGAYEMPKASLKRAVIPCGSKSASAEAQRIVNLAWEETGLFPTAASQSDIVDDHGSLTLAQCDGDAISALLLSRCYGRHGYAASVEDIVRRPTRAAQAVLLDEKRSQHFQTAAAIRS